MLLHRIHGVRERHVAVSLHILLLRVLLLLVNVGLHPSIDVTKQNRVGRKNFPLQALNEDLVWMLVPSITTILPGTCKLCM